MSTPAHIAPLIQQAVRALTSDREALRRIALSEMQWLSVDDIAALTGFEAKTVCKWREQGWIRMFLPGDSREYRTTLQMWREDQDVLIHAGLLDPEGMKPTAKERKRRIAELRKQQLGLKP